MGKRTGKQGCYRSVNQVGSQPRLQGGRRKRSKGLGDSSVVCVPSKHMALSSSPSKEEEEERGGGRETKKERKAQSEEVTFKLLSRDQGDLKDLVRQR